MTDGLVERLPGALVTRALKQEGRTHQANWAS
jgi:hypothetical protein